MRLTRLCLSVIALSAIVLGSEQLVRADGCGGCGCQTHWGGLVSRSGFWGIHENYYCHIDGSHAYRRSRIDFFRYRQWDLCGDGCPCPYGYDQFCACGSSTTIWDGSGAPQNRIYFQGRLWNQSPYDPGILKQSVATEASPRKAPLKSPGESANSQNSALQLHNPSGNKATLSLRIDGRIVQLKPGQSLALSSKLHHIEFDRGGNHGAADLWLSKGNFSLSSSEQGWQLDQTTSLNTLVADKNG